MPKTYKLTK